MQDENKPIEVKIEHHYDFKYLPKCQKRRNDL